MNAIAYAAELRVDELPNQVEVELDLGTARQLIASGLYEPAFGLFVGLHYRRGRGRGCYHLRVSGRRAWLHWDRWDPRRYALNHFFETPELWVPALGAAAFVGYSATKRR